MADVLYKIIYWVARTHDRILALNDRGGWYFDDKQLHFIVIGIVGMLMIFVAYPIFKALAERGHTMVIAWIYVFTMILVISFAIEIGQWWTGTGRMEMADVTYGVGGFIAMFIVFAVLRGFYHVLRDVFRKEKRDERC